MKNNYLVTCALTGGGDTTRKNPNIPITPKEIAKSADEVAKAGATMVHIHVRDSKTGLESTKKEDFIEVVDRIRQQGTDVIINLTTAIGIRVVFDEDDPSKLSPDTDFWPWQRRMEHIEAAMPDVCSLDVPIMNYSDGPYLNLPDQVRGMAKKLQEIKVKPEIECFDLGDMWATQRFIDEEIFDTPPLIQLCMGVKYGAQATPQGLLAMYNLMPKDCIWGTLGVGSSQMQMVALSAMLGGNVRVGLEDNLYISKGKLATNTQLVENAIDIIEKLGGKISSVKEARKILNLRDQ